MTFKERLKKFAGIKTLEELNKVQTPKEKFIEFIKSLLFAGVAAFFIITFVIQNTRIPTPSMEGTILVGDFVIVNKFIFGSTSPRYIPFTETQLPFFQLPAIRDPRPKDIVVFEYPGDADELYAGESKREGSMIRGTNYVKRLIGMPGDVIEVKDKVVFVNGREFFRPPFIQYLSPVPQPSYMVERDIFPPGKQWNRDNYGPLKVPKKGDVIQLTPENVQEWKIIIDREFGKHVVDIQNSQVTIEDKPVTSYTIKKDYYFMMGDNRDASADSRFWGFVPRDLVVGEAFITLFSWDREIPFSEIFKLIGSIRLDRVLRILN